MCIFKGKRYRLQKATFAIWFCSHKSKIAQDISYYGLDNSTKKKEYDSNVYLGVAKIVEDTLQWVIKDRNGVNDHYTTLIEPLGATPYIYQKWAFPMSEAEAFKRAFDNIKGAALGTVKWRIRNDAPCIEQVTFTMPDGKTYKL